MKKHTEFVSDRKVINIRLSISGGRFKDGRTYMMAITQDFMDWVKPEEFNEVIKEFVASALTPYKKKRP
jgi:hypothetical protein